MQKAYVLINTIQGKAEQISREIRQLAPRVIAADTIMGPYDVIAVVSGRNLDEIGHLIISEIQKIDGIERTLTCMAIGAEPANDQSN